MLDAIMLPTALDHELTRTPFVPVRLYLSDGRSYLITNPDLCWIERGAVYVARTDRPNSRIMDDVDLISLRHIVRVEKVDAGGGNGSPKTGPDDGD